MPSVRKSLELPYTPDQLFDLVSDVRAYPDFIKWIRAVRVSDEVQTDKGWRARADAAILFKGISERFITNVDANREDKSVHVDLVRGPFRRLKNAWRFDAADGGGSRVDFFIDYEFRNPLLRMVMAANAERASDLLTELFMAEADRRYGGPDR